MGVKEKNNPVYVYKYSISPLEEVVPFPLFDFYISGCSKPEDIPPVVGFIDGQDLIMTDTVWIIRVVPVMSILLRFGIEFM